MRGVGKTPSVPMIYFQWACILANRNHSVCSAHGPTKHILFCSYFAALQIFYDFSSKADMQTEVCQRVLTVCFICISFTFTPVWFSIWYGSDQLKTWCTLSTQPLMWLCLYCANDAWCHLHSCHTAWWAGTDGFRHEIHLSFISLEPLIVLSLWAVKVCLGMGLCLSVWCEAKWFCVHLWLFDDCLISVWVCVYESFLCGVCLTLVVLHLLAWNELSTGLCFHCVVTRQFALGRKLLTLQCHCCFLLKLWLRGHCVTLSDRPEMAHFINSTHSRFLLGFSVQDS